MTKNERRRGAYKRNAYGDKDIIHCYCGSTTYRGSYSRHLTTRKHVEWERGDRVVVEKKNPNHYHPYERHRPEDTIPRQVTEEKSGDEV